MPIDLRHENGNIYRIDVRGMLRSREFKRCQDSLSEEMGRVGPVRLLICLDGFEGWEPRDDWRDMSFYVRRGDAVERIAIVGQECWRSRTLMFTAADLRKAPVEFFAGDEANARAWLSGQAAPRGGS